jgi:mannitol 2-dehydrogenase
MSELLPLQRAALPAIAARRAGGQPIEIPRYAAPHGRRICHLGVGAFHRSHQAYALHRLHQVGLGEDWGIVGIGLRAADRPLHAALQAQDHLYSLWTLDGAERRVEVIGAIVDHLDASTDPAAALRVLADPATAIVSLTVTEAGYCLGADGCIDLAHPDIAHDLALPQAPRSAPGLLVRALALRRASGLGAFTALSCDNVIANGARLREAVLGLAQERDAALAEWIREHVRFPGSMVDRITPAMTPARRAQLAAESGLDDTVPVVCEDWFQWIIEDDFCAGRPAFERAGAVFSTEVARYEEMKVGLLNGGHSALCHAALLLGHEFVHAALSDSPLRAWLQAYMGEVADTLERPHGVDFDEYRASLLRRFANAAIADRLQRLAQDTREKFRQALLPPLQRRLQRGATFENLALALALWMRYLRTLADDDDARAAYQDSGRDALIAAAAGEAPAFLALALGLDSAAAATVGAVVSRQLTQINGDRLRSYLHDRATRHG